MNVKAYTAGIKKELWEFHNILFWLPIIVAAIFVAFPFIQYWTIEEYQINNIMGGLQSLSGQSLTGVDQDVFANMSFAAISSVIVPFITVSFVVQLYYFTTCLFDERRDLSVYFWRSLPVSDATTVSLKVITGGLVIPAIFLAAATITVLVLLVMALIVTAVLHVGFDISLWAVWGNVSVVSSLVKIWITLLPAFLWLLPVYVWFMLASMFAKKAPFLWAVLPVFILLVIEAIMVNVFNLSSLTILPAIGAYLELSPELVHQYSAATTDKTMLPFWLLVDKVNIAALAVAAVIIYLTYWLRVNRSYA